jgi:hypothetical protein
MQSSVGARFIAPIAIVSNMSDMVDCIRQRGIICLFPREWGAYIERNAVKPIERWGRVGMLDNLNLGGTTKALRFSSL